MQMDLPLVLPFPFLSLTWTSDKGTNALTVLYLESFEQTGRRLSLGAAVLLRVKLKDCFSLHFNQHLQADTNKSEMSINN